MATSPRMTWTSRKLRLLDLDAECLPGHWIGADYVSKIITAVAWKWLDAPDDQSPVALTHYDHNPREIALAAAAEIRKADVVIGHYIRGFDLGLVNGNLLRGRQPPMDEILAWDTKLDLIKTHGRSLSQKNLASEIGVSAPKIEVTIPEWEAFNTRAKGMRQHGINRVTGDVIQNIEMYHRLIQLGWLGPPRVWSPKPRGSTRYHG